MERVIDEYGLGVATELGIASIAGSVSYAEGHAAGRWPSIPGYRGGNFLAFKRAPQADDIERWDEAFASAFRALPEVQHRTYSWSHALYGLGASDTFLERGFTREHTRVLESSQLAVPSTPNRDIQVERVEADDDWKAVVESQVDANEAVTDQAWAFQERIAADYRRMSAPEVGGWYAAREPGGRIVASCGVFLVQDRRARFQSVVTSRSHRKMGIATALVGAVAQIALERLGARSVVITAAADSSAEHIYRSLGFSPVDEMNTLLIHGSG